MKLEIVWIAAMMMVMLSSSLYSQEWSWNTSNELLNPSGITIQPPTSPFLFDIDDDADLDLVIGQGDGTIVLYRNNGFPNTPRWQIDSSYFANFDFAYPVVPTLSDIDNDDSLELVVSFKEAGQWPVDTAKVYRNRGTIHNPVWMELPEYFYSHSEIEFPVEAHKLIDWDDDGDIDLITEGALSASGYLFFVNIGTQGNPFWSPDTTMTRALHFDFAVCGCEGFDIADFNNDGAKDVILSYQVCDDGSGLALFINRGTNIAPQYSPYPDTSFFPGSGYGNNLTKGDIDRDGDIDIISGGSFRVISYYENSGNPSSPFFNSGGARDWCEFYINGCRAFALIDRDADNDRDLVAVATYLVFNPIPYPHYDQFMGGIFYENEGDRYQPEYINARSFYSYFLPVLDAGFSAGDLTSDTFPEIAWGFGDFIFGFDNVNANFQRNDSLFAVINNAGDFRYPELVDLNGDGRLDLIVFNQTAQTLTAFENTGTVYEPTWAEHPSWLAGLDLSATAVNAAYLNGDFLPDLVLKLDSTITAYLNVGTSNNPIFQSAPEVFQSIHGYNIQYFEMADLDGDVDDDIIVNNNGTFVFIKNESVVGVYSDVERLPAGYTLSSHPNPFNARTTIAYTLPAPVDASISVYDITGRRIAVIDGGPRSMGPHSSVWDAAHFPSGVYFARLEAGERSQTIKLILLK